MIDVDKWYSEGGYITSSGTTGDPKDYYQPPSKIKAAGTAALLAQHINEDSRILTVCKLTHAGGMFAQTLPALHVGATVDIEPFNAYTFIDKVQNYTHTHLTPGHIELLSKTKGYETARYDGIFVACGSDRVEWWMIEYFVKRGATFMANWGMSECGPIAINATFHTLEDVYYAKKMCPEGMTILGNKAYCDYEVVDGELHVRGNICIYDDWYATKDKVEDIDGFLYYDGRRNI